jgi:hypothetical protein
MKKEEITIGDQVWMEENLSVDTFRNGDPIPEAKTDEEWVKAGEGEQPAWCWSTDDPEKRKEYGKLYNWYAVNDPRGLALEGYRIPTKDELETLSVKIKQDPKITISLAGMRNRTNGSFYSFGSSGYFWSTNRSGGDIGVLCTSNDDSSLIDSFPSHGYSVLCLKEKSPEEIQKEKDEARLKQEQIQKEKDEARLKQEQIQKEKERVKEEELKTKETKDSWFGFWHFFILCLIFFFFVFLLFGIF